MPCKWQTQNLRPLQPGKGCVGKLAAPLSKLEDERVEIQMRLRSPIALEVMKGTHNYALIQGQKNWIGMDNQEITPSEI
jgi:hypothetical protein